MRNIEDRRRNVSFKKNLQDKKLLAFLDQKATIYGLSNYIKILLQNEMAKEQKSKQSIE